MTTFVLSHNLQLDPQEVPPLKAEELAKGLLKHCKCIEGVEALVHPHWMAKVKSNSSPEEFAKNLTLAWRLIRTDSGHNINHTILALGGRKDDAGRPGSPLQQGNWGFDVVESCEPEDFLKGINWNELKAGRPADGVIEVISPAP